MYCQNCGFQMDPNAAICVKCGCQKGVGDRFCGNCGQTLTQGAAYCMHCGYGVRKVPVAGVNAKSRLAAGLLGIFTGALGIHNFYLGFTGKAVAQLLMSVLSCGILSVVSGIWGLVEGIMYLTGKYNTDADGNPLQD